MEILLISLVISLISCFLTVRFNYLHSTYTADSDFQSVQKFHANPVPRVGGAGIFFSISIVFALINFLKVDTENFGLILLVSSGPVFIAGLTEDLTKKVKVGIRLLFAVISAMLAGFLLNAWIGSLQIFGLDYLILNYQVISFLVTCLAVAGLSNAFNIIDGYNGLSSGVACIVLLGLAYISYKVGDVQILLCALAMVGAILGFLILNYPFGLIFLGDGGAYFIGFWIAELSILLTTRHTEVSKWFPLLLCAYPVVETIFSIYRRVYIKRVNPGLPDAFHLHHMVYRRLVRWSSGLNHAELSLQRNSLTSPYLWLLNLAAVIPALLFWRHHLMLKMFSIIFVIVYIKIYKMIISFKFPKYLVLKSSKK